MTTTVKISSPSTMLLGLGSLAAYAWTRRKRAKASTTRPKPPPASPFVPDSGCTALASEVEVMRWIKEVVEPVLMPRIESYDVPLTEHGLARLAIEQIVDDVYAKTATQCAGYQTSATRLVWKALWCEVVGLLIKRGLVDEEIEDLVALCMDPAFDPRAPKLPPEPTEPTEPLSFVPPPMDGAAEPEEGSADEPPPNVGFASSRQELAQIGVMRLIEGTAGGAPIMGPSARLVLLAINPVWPGLAQARADMQRLAAEHPALAFVEVSFADTQRHFGKPSDVNGIVWVLAAAAPDGRVHPKPIARHDPRDPPPTPAQWGEMIAHASGFVGYGQVRKVVRPRQFGDIVRSLTQQARASQPRAARASRATPRTHRRPRAPAPRPTASRRR